MRGPARQGAVRRVLVVVFRRIIGLYFQAIEASGELPARDTAGRMFLANHTNGIVDPILVLTTAPCPISPIAKSTLWKVPGLRWLLDAVDAVPILRKRDDPTKASGSNEQVFERVAGWLATGHNLLIFPEGTSHNEPHLLEVKTGAARMLVRARAGGATGLTFQSVALEFDARDLFRSRCLLLYGPVRSLDELASAEPDGTRGAPAEEDGERLVGAVTARLRDDLSELLVEGATWPERVLIARVAEMLAHDSGDRTLAGWSSFGRQVEAARKILGGDEAAIGSVGAAVERYYAGLAREGLADEQLAAGGNPASPARVLRGVALLAVLPLALVGAVSYALPYRFPRVVARWAAKEPDEISTYKLGAGMLAYPAWLAALVAASFGLAPAPWSLLLAALAVTSPFAALAWLDAWPRLGQSLRFVRRAARLEGLRAARAEARSQIEATRARLGM